MRITRLRLILLSLLTIIMLLSMSAPAFAKPDRVRLLIGFHRHLSVAREQAVVKELSVFGGMLGKRFHLVPIITAHVPRRAIAALQRMPGVAFVEEDGLVYAIDETLPWGVDRIDAEVVHADNKGSGVKIAIIDSGIDLDHPDLQVYGDVSFVSGTSSGDDDYGHGTHVAGICAALDNDTGVIGVAPQAELYAVKVLNYSGSGYWSDVIEGIQWAVDNGMQVINMSLGASTSSYGLEDACDAAEAAGVVVVAAAGNSGNSWGFGDRVLYPARYDSVIAVAATDSSDARAYFSSTGPDVELAAPGYSIYSTSPGGTYTTKSGTSMASPHVAGLAALVIASGIGDGNGNGRVNDEVRARLQQTAIDLGDPGRDTWFGYGLVNAPAAAPQTNQPPGAPVIGITPGTPVTTDDLVAGVVTPSDDPDGDPVSYGYAWYRNGEKQAGLDTNMVPSANTAKGEVWRCVVTPNDGHGDGTPGEDEVTVQNSVPVADAGGDQAGTVGMPVTLDGSGSWDADGDGLTYAWAQTGGPESVSLAGATTAYPSFTPGEAGDYIFSLVVNDGTADSAADGVVVTVTEANAVPVLSDGGVTPGAGDALTSFVYTVTYTDSDNTTPALVTISINSGAPLLMGVQAGQDGDYTNGEVYEYTISGAGLEVGGNDYKFAASDGTDGAIGDTGVHSGPTVNNSLPGAPVIGITPGTPVTTDDLVAGVVTPSDDPDGDPVSYGYAWYRNGEKQAGLDTNMVPSANTAKGEVWRCVVTPNDGHGDGTPGEDEVTVQNSVPVADAGGDQAGTVGMPVTLDGSGSWDADGDGLTYAWAQTGGPESVSLAGATTAYPSFTPGEAGDYIFSLVVNDGTADSAADEVVITVSALLNTMHVESIEMGILKLYWGWRTYGQATVLLHDAKGDPVPGALVNGHWEGATSDTESGTTDTSGMITFTSNFRRRPPSGTVFTFVIEEVVKADWDWDEDSSMMTGSIEVS